MLHLHSCSELHELIFHLLRNGICKHEIASFQEFPLFVSRFTTYIFLLKLHFFHGVKKSWSVKTCSGRSFCQHSAQGSDRMQHVQTPLSATIFAAHVMMTPVHVRIHVQMTFCITAKDLGHMRMSSFVVHPCAVSKS